MTMVMEMVMLTNCEYFAKQQNRRSVSMCNLQILIALLDILCTEEICFRAKSTVSTTINCPLAKCPF